jgi:hypothetical protein
MPNNFQQNYTHLPADGIHSRFGCTWHTGITYYTKKAAPPTLLE